MIKATLAETAKAYTAEMLGVLVEIATNARLSPGARVTAAEAVLNRGHGKPTQITEFTGKDGGPIETREMSHLEAARRVAFLLRMAIEAPNKEEG